jgi:Aspartyl protease/Tetratricopeptide repeat
VRAFLSKIQSIGWRLAIVALTPFLTTFSAHAQGLSAAALFDRGDFPAAAAAYAETLRANPSDRDAQLGLASVRLFQNDLALAKPLLGSVLAADPQNARARGLLAELERRQAEAGRRTTIDGSESVVPFVTAEPLPVVRATVNGITANFLVDTGGDVDLEPALAAKAHVATVDSGMGNFAGGLKAPTRRGQLQSMALGSATAYDVPVHVFPTHASALFAGTKIDGVVGTTFFERFLTTVDYPRNRLVLRPRSSSASAAFEAGADNAHDAIVPCYLVGDHFVIAPAAVNDAGGLFLFDSGLAGGGVMPSNALVEAAKIPVDRARATTGFGGGGAVTAIPFVAQSVSVGTALQRDVPGIYTPQGSPFSLFPFVVWGAVSHEFLKHYAFTLDFDAMKIVLQAPHAVATAPTAQQIFDAAFRRLQSYPVPPYAVWTSTWHITRTPMGYYTGESSSVEVNRYAVRLADGMENVSDPIPSGKLPPALIEPEFLGPFAWTIRSSVRVAPAQAGGPMLVPDMAGLMTIAHVVSVAKWPYSLAGDAAAPPMEQVDGRQTYHFRLHPRDDPQKHNLRDLWIDVSTYDIWKVRFVGTYRPVPQAPVSPTEATVDFRNVLGCWVVTRARWTYEEAPIVYTFDVQNNEIGLPDALPDWLFDAAEYRKHEAAGEPDYLGLLLERLRKGNASSPSHAATDLVEPPFH